MHINSHFTPANFGASSRPDHAANASGRAQQFEEVPEDVGAAATTDATTAVAATEETEETKTHGNSVAHRARGHLNTLQALEGHNFGWLVSQIAQGIFNPNDYQTPDESSEDEGSEAATASTEETGGGEADTASTETTVATDEDSTASTDETAGETTDPVAELVDELIDDLLDNDEDDSEVA